MEFEQLVVKQSYTYSNKLQPTILHRVESQIVETNDIHRVTRTFYLFEYSLSM